jgi:hypothetical protein
MQYFYMFILRYLISRLVDSVQYHLSGPDYHFY